MTQGGVIEKEHGNDERGGYPDLSQRQLRPEDCFRVFLSRTHITRAVDMTEARWAWSREFSGKHPPQANAPPAKDSFSNRYQHGSFSGSRS